MLDVRMLATSSASVSSRDLETTIPISLWRRATFAFGAFLALVIAGANLGLPLPIFDWVVYLPGGDFGGHALLVGTLAFFAGGAMPKKVGGVISTGALIVALLIVGEEFSQLWLEHRSFSRWDLLGDAIGIVLAESLRRRGGLILWRILCMLK